jgi:GntR family transcriptional regulator
MTSNGTYSRAVPLHHQVARAIRAELRAGAWTSDEQLPTEMALVERFGVSRTTIREALRSLEHDGLISRRQGRGTFVASSRPSARLATITDAFLGYKAKVRVVASSLVAAPEPIAAFFGMAKGDPVRRFVRVEMVDDGPLSVIFNFLPEPLGRRLRMSDLRRHSILDCLRDRLGVRLGLIRQVIEARTADYEVAGLLKVDLIQPILFLRRLMSDANGVSVQVSDMFYHSERFRYETVLPFEAMSGQNPARDTP